VILSGIKSPIRPNKTYRGTVTIINTAGETPLAKDTIVLSGNGMGADFLKQNATVGQELSFRLEVASLSPNPIDLASIQEAVAGGPRLLTDGKVTITDSAEGIAPSFSTTRHPRTAAGVTAKGKLLLMVVDGRQKGVSRGVSLSELANLFLKYGAKDAVNLDGGGSSTAIVRDLIVNSPSEGKERAVANALLVCAPLPDKKSKESDTSISLPTPPAPLFPGAHFAFGSTFPSGKGVWGIAGGIGFISQTGNFTAVRSGSGVIFYLPDEGQVPLRIPVTVAVPVKPEPPPPKAEPGEPDL
jgi:hypothetical protein